MKKEALSQFGNPELILFGFLLFFTCFLGILVWVSWKNNRKHFDKMSHMPFERNSDEVKNNG